MVSLARAAYQSPRTDPTELTHPGDPQQIRGRLLDAYIHGVHDPGQSNTPRPLRRYHPDAARRYLGMMALNLYLLGTVEWAWWQLRADLYTRRSHLAPACAAALLTCGAGLATACLAGVWTGIWTAVAAGGALTAAAKGWLRPVWPHNHPAYRPTTYRTARQWRRLIRLLRAAVAAWCALLTGLLTGQHAAGAAGAAAAAVALSVLPTDRITPRPRTATPDATLRAHHRATLVAALQHATAGTPILTAAAALTGTAPTWQLATVAAAIYAWTAACPAGLWTWLRYRAIHLRLAARGWLPLRLNAFLHDQHRRGTLRQSGTTWQIRHLILQEHLAATARVPHLTARARQGDLQAAWNLADLGRVDEAVGLLRARADQGDWHAAERLAGVLERAGREEELRARADQGDRYAAGRLAGVLERAGREEELRARADQGDRYAARRLAGVLERAGRVDEAVDLLRTLVDRGDQDAAERLAELLKHTGRRHGMS